MKPKQPLKTQAIKSAFWSAIQVGGNQVTAFVVFLIFARLLGPAEIGLVALAMAFVELGVVMGRAGMPEALIQQDQVTDTQADTAFWFSVIAASVLAGATLMLAGPVADAFDTPALGPVIEALSTILLFTALGSTHEARLTRAFGFKALAVRLLLSNLIGGATGIWMAIEGFGVWSLVAHRIIAAAGMTLCVWIAFPWRPKFRFSFSAWKLLCGFGANMMLTRILSHLSPRIYDLAAGFFLGTTAVGFLRLAWSCIDLITRMTVAFLAAVAFPTFSRLQDDKAALERAFIRVTEVGAALLLPAFFGAAVLAPDLIPLIFGDIWAPSSTVLQILCLTALPIVLQHFAWPALAAIGRSGWAAGANVAIVGLGALLSLVAAPYGIVAVAVAHLVRAFVTMPLGLMLLKYFVGIRVQQVVHAIVPALASATLMAMVVFVARTTLAPHLHPIPLTTGLIATGGLLYGGMMFLMARPLVNSMLESCRLLVRKRQADRSTFGTQL